MNPLQYALYRARKYAGNQLARLATQLDPPMSRQSGATRLPGSRVIKASFHFALPTPATEAQIEEWVKFELGGGTLSGSNPLSDHELSAMGNVHLGDTGLHEHLRFVGTPKRFSVYTSLKPEPYVGPTSTDIIMNPNHPALQPDDDNA